MDINEKKFTWEHGDVTIYDENYNKINFEDFQNQKEINTTFKDQIHVGDIIKTKRTGRIVVIKYIDYNINNKYHADYAGTIYNSDSDDLLLLGSDDIEKRIYDSSEEKNKNKIR